MLGGRGFENQLYLIESIYEVSLIPSHTFRSPTDLIDSIEG